MSERQFKESDVTHTREEMRGITGDAGDRFTRADIPIVPTDPTNPADRTIYNGNEIRTQMGPLLSQASDRNESSTLGGSPGESTEPEIG